MTALDFANDRDNVCVFIAGNGCPGGMTIALLDGTELPFGLEEVEGAVNADGTFEADNLNDGSGAWGWRFHDWNANLLYKIQLFEDATEWQRQQGEYEASV